MYPILSISESLYHPIANVVTRVTKCQIKTSSKEIAEFARLKEDDAIISFHIVSLFTNVPVEETIDTCADLLYCGNETFKELLQIYICDVLMQTHDDFYRQTDGRIAWVAHLTLYW